jgi:hypothetical protein
MLTPNPRNCAVRASGHLEGFTVMRIRRKTLLLLVSPFVLLIVAA